MQVFEYSDKCFVETESDACKPLTTAANSIKTMANLLDAMKVWDKCTEKKHYMAVRACVGILARNLSMENAPPSAFACDLAYLNKTLFMLPAKAHGITKETMDNYVCFLRVVLRHAGLLHDTVKPVRPTEGPWAVVLSALNCTYAIRGLASFAAWCHGQGILPEAVCTTTFAAFERFQQTQRLHANISHHSGNIAKSWRRLVKQGDVAASTTLSAPNRRQSYTFPLSTLSASFQKDHAKFVQHISGAKSEGPFRRAGPPKPLSDSTIKTRLFSLRQAVSALVHEGRDIDSITSLADLVQEDAFKLILTYFWRHAIELKIQRGELSAKVEHDPEDGVTVQTGAIAAALMMVARYHVNLDAVALECLKDLAKDVRPAAQTAINAKTRKILNALSVPATRARLLHLPGILMTLAEGHLPERPLEAGRLAMIATAIKIELMLPLRIGNLSGLRLDTHLQHFDPRSHLPSLLHIPKHEVKNRVTIEWPIDPATGEFIARYVRDFRPLLSPGSSTWLFPSGHGERLNARSNDAIRLGITNAIEEHVGVIMHVHAFRAFVGMLLLEDAPGALEDLRLLLGHKTLQMAERYYAYVKPAHAAQRMVAVMDRARSGLSRVAGHQQPTKQPPGAKPKARP